jgi:hypothetical protein
LIELAVVLIALVAAGFVARSVIVKSRAKRELGSAVGEAAKRLSARASLGTDAPELRVELEGFTVTAKLSARGTATASTRLEEGAETLRIFVGWDVARAPDGLAHFPEIALPVAYTFTGNVLTRANERELAERILERIARTLIDLRDTARAKTLSLIVRGGHLELELTGIAEDAEVIEALAKATAAIAGKLTAGERSQPALPAERRCAACVDRGKEGEVWAKCAKCGGQYHHACFMKAGGCVIPGCGETSSELLA